MKKECYAVSVLFFLIFSVFSYHAKADIRGLPTVNVMAVSSLSQVMTEIVQRYAKHTGNTVSITFGNTAELLEQVIEGEEADIFISDYGESIKQLKQLGLIDVYSVTNLAKDRLVLAAARGHSAISYKEKEEHDSMWWLTKIAAKEVPAAIFVLGDYNIVPVGLYARQVLESANVWEALQPSFMLASDVQHVNYMIARGGYIGIMYASNAKADAEVEVLATIDDAKHDPIIYQSAVLASENMTYARDFLDFIKQDEIKMLLKKYYLSAF